MFPSIRLSRVSGSAVRLSALSAALLAIAGFVPQAAAQTTTVAPQLLPYTSQLIAGGGKTAATVGATCTNANGGSSGYVSYDIYGDGCLASEIALGNPKAAVVGPHGAIYFTDYSSAKIGVVHRIDPATGIVTAVAGGASTSPASGAACGGADHNTVTTGDVFGDGCLATSVKLTEPTGLAFSASGDLYIADEYAENVRKVSLSNGGVSSVIITNGGSNYATAPTVTFSAPASGTTATGTAVIGGSGAVTSVTITNAGSGYTSAPTVTFSVAPTGDITATGTAVETGVISMAVGSDGGTSTAYGYGAATGCTAAPGANSCVLRSIYSIAFDKSGVLYIVDEYYYAVLGLNPTSTTQTVLGVTIPAGMMELVSGYKSGGCTNGDATSSGCSDGTYTNGSAAFTSGDVFYSPYGVAVDSSGNVYINDFEYGNVAQLSGGTSLVNGGPSSYLNGVLVAAVPAAGTVNSYAGSLPLTHTYAKPAASTRGIANTFDIGADYGVGVDPNNNVYVTDETNGYIWRVDGASQTMYVVGGGRTTPLTSGAACSGSFPGSSMTATDAFGDGCPAKNASFDTYLFDVTPDTNSNVYVADNGNLVYRELATGAQFGNTGASQTDYLDIHFAGNDTPLATGAYTITSGSAIFTVGTVSCTTNADNNATFGNTTDCIVAVTASPTASGPYSGTLMVASTNDPTGVSFPLTGDFVQSPITRVAITSSSTATASCTSTTIYPTTTPVILTASLTANGPTAPTGTITFFSGTTQLGSPVNVTNIGTTASPVYGATLSNTFSTPGTYSVTAQYTPATPSYFDSSTSAPATLTSSAPTFTAAPISYSESTVSPGGTALYSFTVSTSVYTGTVTFACSGLPANSTCSFSPSSITGAGCSTVSTIALSIQTQAGTVVQVAGLGGMGGGVWSMVAVFAGLFMATLLGVFRRRIPLRTGQLLLVFALLLAATGLTACGKAAGTQLTPPTPAFNGNVTVTAKGSDSTVSSFTVPLTVR